MSTPKYYLTQNCNRRIALGATVFEFQPVGLLAGAWQGVYATAIESEQAIMAGLMQNPTNAIEEISHECYSAKLAGKPEYVNGFNPIPESIIQPPRPAPEAIINRPGTVVVETPGPENQKEPVATSGPVEEADAIQTGEVTESATPATPAPAVEAPKVE